MAQSTRHSTPTRMASSERQTCCWQSKIARQPTCCWQPTIARQPAESSYRRSFLPSAPPGDEPTPVNKSKKNTNTTTTVTLSKRPSACESRRVPQWLWTPYPINRLPDELVLHILHCLDHDPLTMLCLRRVSRRFRRIIYDREIWSFRRVGNRYSELDSSSKEESRMPKDLKEELWRRIQRDGMCDECRMLRLGALDIDNPGATWRRSPYRCPAKSRSPLGLHCGSCISSGIGHDYVHPCLGRHGSVRLCEHVNISWADMEPYLSEWHQRQDPHNDGGQACLDGFSVQCRDPSHDFRCRAEDAPTWPRASLKVKKPIARVVLTFEWSPHSGSDVFSITRERQAPVSEMKSMLQRYRQGAADILFPSYPQLPLPEMASAIPNLGVRVRSSPRVGGVPFGVGGVSFGFGGVPFSLCILELDGDIRLVRFNLLTALDGVVSFPPSLGKCFFSEDVCETNNGVNK
ncbi:hypothetical protein B0T26DRAFT_803592 [Lasiosphaeria miniovina]|uniref:F-box domain-containing protein n=1 Tax=Lasiosphaeria miniovina TaxID=1954250 RepID=A0AA40DT63_9PEZI|nr:uncharacterized protein B0T26DRAFT_803592 [Lasiosphaeria miniovina]KAK0712536.1 hypothetical protein B0T26DRAFT_803592 [Lasiosphaeria miniovina]